MNSRHTTRPGVQTRPEPVGSKLHSPKLPYQSPRVIDYGSLTDLTGSATGTNMDTVPFMATGVNP